MVTTARLDTPARWTAALDRAHTNHIQVFADRVTGQFFALSSDATKLYAVDYYTCSCAAGTGSDPVCQHRALYREMVRVEDAVVVEHVIVEPALKMPQHRMCTSCLDTGWARMYLGYGLNDYTEVPCRCGAGVAAVA